MRRTLVLLLLVLSIALPLHAAEIEVGAQHVMNGAARSGALEIKTGRGFGASVEIFWRDAISTRATATFLNPAAILLPEAPPPADVDLGTLGLDIYAFTARYRCGPLARFSAFAGAGGAFVDIGNLDDQFGDAVEVEFDRELALVAEAGVRYRIHPRVALEAGVVYMPLEAESDIRRANDPRITLPATIRIDPLIISAGASWRF